VLGGKCDENRITGAGSVVGQKVPTSNWVLRGNNEDGKKKSGAKKRLQGGFMTIPKNSEEPYEKRCN